jgi:ABC-type Fe3+/spermidine/putrescine transport system ATPase subunit
MFELKNATLTLEEHTVFSGLNLSVTEGEIVSILGPSGCGKTSLLRVCCGLERLEVGERVLGQSPVLNGELIPEITMLFQQPVLYPHLNVAQNIGLGAPKSVQQGMDSEQPSGKFTHALPPLRRKLAKELRDKRINEVLASVGLSGFNERRVAGLSGGEAQRVAFGRALLQGPKVMLLDEPFASVDVGLRLELATMARHHLKEHNISAIHVTHDEREAKVLSDRILRWETLQPAAYGGLSNGGDEA